MISKYFILMPRETIFHYENDKLESTIPSGFGLFCFLKCQTHQFSLQIDGNYFVSKIHVLRIFSVCLHQTKLMFHDTIISAK